MKSDKGARLVLDLMQNKGEFFEAGITRYMCWRDVIGHNGGDTNLLGFFPVLNSLGPFDYHSAGILRECKISSCQMSGRVKLPGRVRKNIRET